VSFSRRVPAELAPNRLSRALSTARREGRAIIDLTQSNPTTASFDYPSDLLAALADPRALTYRPEPFGLGEARAAVAADFARRGLTVTPDRIALTSSTSEAYSLLFKVLCNPGDQVLVPQPSYPLFEHLTRLDAVEAVPYRLEYHGQWSIDLASVERALAPSTRALLIVSPNNPTGSFVSAAELDALAALCGPRQIAVISDEVFADYGFEAASSAGARQRANLTARTDVLGFTLGGLSKSIGLPQAKLAWIAVSGDAAALEAALSRLEFACDAYLSVSTPVQVAARALLDAGAAVRDQIRRRTRTNLDACRALVAHAPSCSLLHADGGWTCVLQVPTLQPEEDLVIASLEERSVLAHPGFFFDFARESFLVLSLLTPESEFAEGVSRLLHAFPADRPA
jgi:alanine-synthesizing transaminase